MVQRISRRERLGDLAELTGEQERQLLHGRGFLVPSPFRSLEEMEPAWKLHRDTLREKWAAQHPPGTRCFSEWVFELVPQFGERQTTEYFRREHQQARHQFVIMGILHTNTWPPMQEAEHEYLYRHGVLDETEYQEAVALCAAQM